MVLDLSEQISGPYCTKLMSGLGAEVIKIEKPGQGDIARRMPPFLGDVPHPEKSGLFLHLNTGKKSITLNLETETGRKIFKELVEKADVVVENFKPGVMANLGLSYEILEKVNPRLIMTSITYFGQTGPYRDYEAKDITAFAMGGVMYLTGEPDREPLKAGGAQAEYVGGLWGFLGTVLAYYWGERTEVGQHVDVSIMECLARMLEGAPLKYFHAGVIRPRQGARHDQAYPSTQLPCKDGYVHVHGNVRNWDLLSVFVGEPRLLNPDFAAAPRQHADEIDALLLPFLKERNKNDLFHSAQEMRVPFAKVATFDEVLKDPQYEAREFFIEVDHPIAGKLTYPGAPFKMTETPWRMGRAPLLGEHNEEVYRGLLGYCQEDLVKLKEGGII